MSGGLRYANVDPRAAAAKLARDMIGAYASGWFPVDKNPDGPMLWNTVEQRAIIQPTCSFSP